MTTYTAKPFVKWVGGKTQLLNEIQRTLPKDFGAWEEITYVEPFVGGGAVLFWILQKYPNIKRAVINDINSELVCTYRIIKSEVQTLIEQLQILENAYLPLPSEERKYFFLEKRAVFNSHNNADVETAALFIFLNRTCFNGLYRVNSKGFFNVPHGRYKNPRICDPDNLKAVSSVLQRVEILNGNFMKTEVYANPLTLYYLDPPYRPISSTSSFTSYSSSGFDDEEQIRLRDFCTHITQCGAKFIASNSDPKGINPEDKFFDEIYGQFRIRRVHASRSINSNPDGRGNISEILISNITTTNDPL